ASEAGRAGAQTRRGGRATLSPIPVSRGPLETPAKAFQSRRDIPAYNIHIVAIDDLAASLFAAALGFPAVLEHLPQQLRGVIFVRLRPARSAVVVSNRRRQLRVGPTDREPGRLVEIVRVAGVVRRHDR